jgi:DNA-binding MarR family transcriptional regulator
MKMSGSSSEGYPTEKPPSTTGGRGESSFFRFLRSTHIFSSAVREILETKLLREVTPLPLTLSQLYLLKLMSSNGQHQVGQVADFLGVSAPAATKNVDKLERLKLLVRSPSTGDRRATLLSLSSRGRELVHDYEELKAARLLPLLKSFTQTEVEQLSELMERFSVALLRFGGSENDPCLRCAAYIDAGCPVGQIRGGCPYHKNRGDAMARAAR